MSCFERHAYVKYTNIPYITRFGVPFQKTINPLYNMKYPTESYQDNRTIVRSSQPNQCISTVLPVNGTNQIYARYFSH